MSTNINFNKKLGITGGAGITLPTSSTPSFSNVNSFLFDGIDEKMLSTANYTELNGTQNFSISFWIKPIDPNAGVVWRLGSQSGVNRLACIYRPANESIDISFNVNSYYFRTPTSSVLLNKWSHIVYTYDGTQSRNDRPKIYVNGVLSQGANSGVIVTSSSFDGALELGGTGTSGTINFGNNYIDEVGIWNNTTLTQTQANELYNGGTPSDLNNIASGLAQPTTWFRMGELASWDGTKWTMTDVNGGTTLTSAFMVEASKTTDVPPNPFANLRSILLDGIDDYVDCGLGLGNSQGTITAFSVSMWIKPSVTSGNDLFFNIGNFSNSFGEIAFQLLSNKLYVKLNNGTRNYNVAYTNTTAWQHLAFVYDGSNSANTKMYINGVLQSPSTGGVYPSSLNLSGLKTIIGAGYSVSYPYSGLQDEVSYFNTTLSQSDITSIYNDGVPNDISSLSPLSWWRCGDGDTSPTLIDNGSGGNNGTMVFFNTFSTDVPT